MSTQTEVERRSRLPFDLLRHLDRAWYTDVLLYSIETHLKVEIVVVVSDNLWKFDTIPDMSGVYGATYEKEGMGSGNVTTLKYFVTFFDEVKANLI